MGSLVQVAGKLVGYDPVKDAAKIQQRSAEEQGAIAQEQWKQNLGLMDKNQTATESVLNPYITAGNRAYQIQQNISGVNGVDAQKAAYDAYQQSPGVKFAQEQGMRTIDTNMNNAGTLGGGSRLKAISQFNQGLAMQDFANQFARTKDVADTGMTASTNLINSRTSNVSNIVAGQNQAAQDRANVLANVASSRAGVKLNNAQLMDSIGNQAANAAMTYINPMSLFNKPQNNVVQTASNGAQSSPANTQVKKLPWE
jgi:hypothetical protein